jgi:hypothetical protein
MANAASDLATREHRLACRLARLFRIQRAGRFERRPEDVARRLVERRAVLIERLMRLDHERRVVAPRPPAGLDRAMNALAGEVDAAERWGLDRLDEIGAELSRRRRAAASGLRDGATGQLLGRG